MLRERSVRIDLQLDHLARLTSTGIHSCVKEVNPVEPQGDLRPRPLGQPFSPEIFTPLC
jgi:hypothetical protein